MTAKDKKALNILKREFGIRNEQELDVAISKMEKANISILTTAVGGKENGQNAQRKNGGNHGAAEFAR